MLNMNTSHVVKVTTDSSVGTNTELQNDLQDDFGLGDSWNGATPIFVEKVDSSGDPVTLDEQVSIDSNGVLRIAEGTGGFTAGDVYTVLLVNGNISDIESAST